MEENKSQDNADKKINSGAPPVVGQEKPIGHEEHPHRAKSRYPKIKKWLKGEIVPTPELVFNFLLMIGTFLLFSIAYHQSGSADKQFVIANSPVMTIGKVEYVYPPGARRSPPLTPDTAKDLRLFLYNLGNHPIHVYYIKYKSTFDTSEEKQIQILADMKSDTLRSFNWYSQTGPPRDITIHAFDRKVTSKDSAGMYNGKCLIYLDLEYYNDITNCWRTYMLIMSLKDHQSQQSLLENIYYNENLDSPSMPRPIPNHN